MEKKSTLPIKALLGTALRTMTPISEPELELAASFFTLVRLAKGQALVRTGEQNNQFGLVVGGLMRKYYLGSDGRESTRGFAVPGQFAGPYGSLLQNESSNMVVEAVVETSLLVADFHRIRPLIEGTNPTWQAIGRLFAEAAFLDRERREYQLLTQNATERYRQFRIDFAAYLDQIPHYLVAQYLGITNVALSRIRRQLQLVGTR